jgi:hypothetical protein
MPGMANAAAIALESSKLLIEFFIVYPPQGIKVKQVRKRKNIESSTSHSFQRDGFLLSL